MNSLDISIDALIENIQVSEHHAEKQRKLLKSREAEIKEIETQISSIKEERNKIIEGIKGKTIEFMEKEALVISLEKEIEIMTKIHKDLKELHDKEENILNEKQQNVWKNRESFCDQFHKISEELRSMGTSWLRKADNHLMVKKSSSDLDDEKHKLFNNIKKLEEDIQVAKKATSDAELKLMEFKLTKEKLMSEPDFGEEFIRLQMQLTEVQSEIESLENHPDYIKEQQQIQQLVNKKWKQQTLHRMALSEITTASKLYEKESNLENSMIKKNNSTNMIGKENDIESLNLYLNKGLKRPVASNIIASGDKLEENGSSKSKQVTNIRRSSKLPCKFVPKIQSSIGKKYLSRSNNWIQLQQELTALLNKDTRK